MALAEESVNVVVQFSHQAFNMFLFVQFYNIIRVINVLIELYTTEKITIYSYNQSSKDLELVRHWFDTVLA